MNIQNLIDKLVKLRDESLLKGDSQVYVDIGITCDNDENIYEEYDIDSVYINSSNEIQLNIRMD